MATNPLRTVRGNRPAHIPQRGGWIIPQALSEIEDITETVERLAISTRRRGKGRCALHDDVAGIRRACRNLRQDVRGLGRLLEERGKRP